MSNLDARLRTHMRMGSPQRPGGDKPVCDSRPSGSDDLSDRICLMKDGDVQQIVPHGLVSYTG